MKKLMALIFALAIVFSVTMIAAAAEVDVTPVEVTEEFSFSWTNPLLGASPELSEVTSSNAVLLQDQLQYHTDSTSAGIELRSALRNRMETVAIGYRIPAEQFSDEGFSAIVTEIMDVALAHTGVPNEGDYISNHIAYWNCDMESTIPADDGTCYDATLIFEFVMNSTADEEAAVDHQVDVLLESLNLTGTDYEKIKVIYDWICENVYYDYEYLQQAQNGNINLSKHSAYAALVQKMTVCQGYSSLLYRLALEAGVDCRIIIGSSHNQSHSWNIVKIDGQYYNLDSTWDVELRMYGNAYEYFLRCEENFPDHTRDEGYLTSSFLKQYPVAESDYNAHPDAYEYVSGDFVFLIENGQATLTAYTGRAKEVTIPGTADGVPVRLLGVHAFEDNTIIEKVTFAPSIVNTEDGWCTSGPTKFYGTFANCVNLKSVVIPADSKLVRLGKNAFYGCESLKDIALPSSIRELALGCFQDCISLVTIDLPEGLENVGQNAFTGSGLRSIRIPASCQLFHNFNNMPMLEKFVVAEGNSQYRTHEGVLYDNQPPTGSYSGWTLIGYPMNKPGDSYRVADFCTHIWGDVWAGETAQPKHLKTIYIGNTDAAMALGGGISLSRIRFRVIPDATNPYFTSYNNMLFTKDMKTLIQVPSDLTGVVVVPNGTEYVEDYAAEWGNYTTLILPDTVHTMGGAVFWYTNSVQSIYIPGTVTQITGSSLFQDCDSLKNVYFGGTKDQWESVFNAQDVLFNPLYNAPGFKTHFKTQISITDATCSENGKYKLTCSDCKTTMSGNISKNHDFMPTVSLPTCTKSGYTTHTCTCGKTYKNNEVAALGHREIVDKGYAATCTTDGMTDGKHCSVCNEVLVTQTVIPAGHTWDTGVVIKEATLEAPGVRKFTCSVCGASYQEEYMQRFAGSDRIATALAVATELKAVLGVNKFDNIIIAAGGSGKDNNKFADALSGSYLASVKKAPILLYTKGDLAEANLAFIQENMSKDGTIYLLGGEAAVPASVAEALAGYKVERLYGNDRYETNRIILNEAGMTGAKEILIATGTNFADSLSASATGLPIMLVKGSNTELNAQQIEFLNGLKGKKFTILGGEAAVSAELEAAIEAVIGADVERIFGSKREETSTMIAKKYFPEADFALIAYSKNYPDGLAGGVLANALGAPLLLTNAGNEEYAKAYIEKTGVEGGCVLGGTAAVTNETAKIIFDLE